MATTSVLFSKLANLLYPFSPNNMPTTNNALERNPCYGQSFWHCYKSSDESTAFLTFHIGVIVLLFILFLAGICYSWGFLVCPDFEEEILEKLNPEKVMEEGNTYENSPNFGVAWELNAPSCRSSQSDCETVWKCQGMV